MKKAVLAISFVVGERKNFNAAWIALAVSTMCHVHEGLYGFVTVFILLLTEIIYWKKFSIRDNVGIFLYLGVLGGVIIPNMLTDPINISNEEFIYIYATFRHPHHLVPSTWDKNITILSLCLILFPGCYRIEELVFYENKKVKKFVIEFVLFVISWIAALGIMYIGTEKLYNVAITTMFISKFFKYVAVVSLIWYMKTIRDYFEQKKYIYGFMILVFAGMAHLWKLQYAPCVCMIITTFIWYGLNNKSDIEKENNNSWVLFLGAIFMTGVLFGPVSDMSMELRRTLVLIALMILCRWQWKLTDRKLFKRTTIVSLIALLITCPYGDFYQLTNGRLGIILPEDVLIASAGRDICQLGDAFEKQTDSNITWLADPDDGGNVGWLQVISERNCYVIRKVVPCFKGKMKEWYERYQDTAGLFEKDATEIVTIMKNNDIRYLLVNRDNYEKVEREEIFALFLTCEGDTYRIYQLVE